MANTPKYSAPARRSATAPVAMLIDPTGMDTTRLSPRIETLRKLVAQGQYQVSAHYLAQRIMRAAGITLE
jgi:anti-sigma28 factor (negative regulator of flagellin synthesis)